MLIFAAILAIFVYGMIAAMLGTILPDLSDRFHLTPTQNGTIAFAQALGLMIASLGVGPLLDTQGDKIGLILGLASIAVGSLPSAALRRLPRHRASALPARHGRRHRGHRRQRSGHGVSDAHRATALNLVNLFFGLGGLATPFISANLFKQNWVRLCYTVASLTVVALVVQAVAHMPAPTGNARFLLADAGPILGRPLLFMLGLFLFLYVSCEVGVWNWLPRHLIAQGIPESRALNILSLGFALGLLIGRVGVSPILIHASRSRGHARRLHRHGHHHLPHASHQQARLAFALVFIAGLSMAPVFPTTLAITGTAFPRMTGTAIGFVITCGWAGLAVSSRIIGAIAGGDPRRLKKALLLFPASAVLMVVLNVAIWSIVR